MTKKGLLSKLMGKQDNDCCSVSFEEVSEEEAEQQKGRKHTESEAEGKAKVEEHQETAAEG